MKFHDTLNQKLWDKKAKDDKTEYTLKTDVAKKLKEIANAFIKYLEVDKKAIKDVVITGSSASFNYTEHSDLDLHLKVDYDKVHKDCPIVEGYLWALKSAFNKDHGISIFGVPVEVYAESLDSDTVHNGLYSLWQGKWIDEPKPIPPTDNDAAVKAKVDEIKEAANRVKDSEVATELLNKLYEMRKAGLEDVGEFSTENLAFKKLRDAGVLDKLRKMKKEQIDKQLSLESYNETTQNNTEDILNLIKEGLGYLAFDVNYDKFEAKLNKIKQIKSTTILLKEAKLLLLNMQGRLVDEQYDEYNERVERFLRDISLRHKLKDEHSINKTAIQETISIGLKHSKVLGKDDFIKNYITEAKDTDMEIIEKTIYNPSLILEAHAIENKWYKSLGLTNDEQAPQIMLFIIEDKQIKSTRLIQRGLVAEYEPYENEYYLDRTRDTGDVVTDYNLAPAQKLVDTFKNSDVFAEDINTLCDKVDKAEQSLEVVLQKLKTPEVNAKLCAAIHEAMNEDVNSGLLPYVKTVLNSIKGINPNDIYKDEDNNYLVIPVKRGANFTDTKAEIHKRLSKTWVKKYADKIKISGGDLIITFKEAADDLTIAELEKQGIDVANLFRACQYVYYGFYEDRGKKMTPEKLLTFLEKHVNTEEDNFGARWIRERYPEAIKLVKEWLDGQEGRNS